VVSRALLALLPRGRGRGWAEANSATHSAVGISVRPFVARQACTRVSVARAGSTSANRRRSSETSESNDRS